jgi:hypothetical protein
VDSFNDVLSIDSALLRIAQYAEENSLTPLEVCDYFTAGLFAARVLRNQNDLSQSSPSIHRM